MQETISFLDLKQLTDEALGAIGLSGTDREIVRDVLLFAELRGNNQGLVKIPQKAVQPSPDATPMVVEQPFPAVAHIKGNGQVGMVVMDRAVEVVVNAATQCGIGAGGNIRHVNLDRCGRLFCCEDCESRQDRDRDVRNAEGRCS